MSAPRVFVTDGSYPNTLAAVRALGKAGFQVTVAEREGVSLPETIAFWSRHCSVRFRYPDPRISPEAAVAALAGEFRRRRYDAAIPVGLEMTSLFVKNRGQFAVPVMLPPDAGFEIARDKRRTFPHCAAMGIPVPRTVPARAWHELGLPLVFKHYASGATIARTEQEAAAQASVLAGVLDEYIAQEYVPGENGFGYFGFFENGVERAYFMHERLMQIPKEGGPSVVARALHDARLRALGRSVLESLCWHGVAMVEFKRSDRDGDFYLMEVNPKLWGSLDLAIQSGCDFPVWVARMVIEGRPPDCQAYDESSRYQWVVPNGLKCFLRYPEFRMPFLRNIFAPKVHKDIRLSDPLPSAAGLISMAANWSKR